jgi:hypothetical protein
MEAAANAIPLIGPQGTSLERIIREFGGGGAVFQRQDSEGIVQTTLDAIDRFDVLAGAAFAGARKFASENGKKRVVDEILLSASR